MEYHYLRSVGHRVRRQNLPRMAVIAHDEIGAYIVTDGRYEVVDRMPDRTLPGPSGGAWTREELAGLEVELPPYGVMLLELRRQVD